MHIKENRIPFILAIAAALIAGGLVAGYILQASSSAPSIAETASPSAVAYAQATSTPVRLLIPSLGINAAVQQVGRTASGAMGDPSNFTDVAWYKYGTVPGQEGSAVIGGHLDNALALNGVFKHLDELVIGQDIQIQTASDTVLTFRVTDIEDYSYTQVPGSFFTKTGGIYLNLITCAGTWLPQARSYDHRLVVYTTLVS